MSKRGRGQAEDKHREKKAKKVKMSKDNRVDDDTTSKLRDIQDIDSKNLQNTSDIFPKGPKGWRNGNSGESLEPDTKTKDGSNTVENDEVKSETKEEKKYDPFLSQLEAIENMADSTDDILRLSETISLEHAVSTLQQSIKTILGSKFNEEKLKEIKSSRDKISSPQALLALDRKKLALVAKLNTLHDAQKLKLFDQILKYDEDDQNSEELDVLDIQDIVQSIGAQGMKIEKETLKTKPPPSESESLPELPQIKNPRIRAQVFVHRSVTNVQVFLSEKEQVMAHNERFEFIGDSVLNNIMTFIVVNYHPHATEGELSQLRTRLINNATLLKWSVAYGFDKKLHYQTDDHILLGKKKIFADVFEAYIGGLITDDPSNYNVIYEWLKKLAIPILLDNKDGVTKRVNTNERGDLNQNAKVELYSLIGFARLGLKYECIERTFEKDYTNFVVQVKVNSGEVLGQGSGKNQKEAGMRAAMSVLANKEIIEKYSRLRASIPREDSARPDDSHGDKEEYLRKKQELKAVNKAVSEQEIKEKLETIKTGTDMTSSCLARVPSSDLSSDHWSKRDGDGDGARRRTFNDRF